jgi:hypothetical protein
MGHENLSDQSNRENEITQKNDTVLEWTEPRDAWHITEARWFSPLFLVLFFVIGFVTFFLVLEIAMKIHPPDHIGKDTLTFSKLPAFSAVCSALCVALYASLWWWASLKVRLTSSGIEKTYHNYTKTWKYDRVKTYGFELLRSKTDVYTLLILRNQKGKVWKIAFDESINKSNIENILTEHRITKVE